MAVTFSLIRMFFMLISILFATTLATQTLEGGMTVINVAVGVLGGAILASLLIGLDFVFKKFNLRAFNTAVLGLFVGYLLGQVLVSTLDSILGPQLNYSMISLFRFLIFAASMYVAMMMTARSAEEIRVSIPFVEFKSTAPKKKDILVDVSVLMDPRIIDLASSGLLDHQLILPRFALKELYSQAEMVDEDIRSKARRSIEVVKKLESTPSLEMRIVDTDFPEIKDSMMKLIRLARFLDTNIITSDINRVQQSSIEEVRIINIHLLSNALKPITQAGEMLNIKIQRYGKEARQGVGYLEDGTMVVVNGGAEFIGETIKAHVLSVKHTSSGRMIFCNAAEEGSLMIDQDFSSTPLTSPTDMDPTQKKYLTF